MASIWGYLAASHVMLIPSKECPVTDVLDVRYLPGDFSIRAWTRLETMAFTALSPVTLGDMFVVSQTAAKKAEDRKPYFEQCVP